MTLLAPWLVEFENVTSSGQWSDCTFVVGSHENTIPLGSAEPQEVRAHKLILALASPRFKDMFHEGLSEHSGPLRITISDVKPEIFKALIKYTYTGRINHFLTSFDIAWELLLAAQEYMLPDLETKCISYIWSHLAPTNVCKVYEFARRMEAKLLMDMCIQIISTDTIAVLKDRSFKGAALETVQMVLSLENLNVESELDLFNAVVEYDKARRRPGQSSSPANSGDGEPSAEELSDSVEPTVEPPISSVEPTLEPPISEDQVLQLNGESGSNNSPAVELDTKEPSEEVVTSEPPADGDNLEEGDIKELMKKIRFLSLNAKEFADGIGSSELLTMDQKLVILMNISLETIAYKEMPTGFSISRERRQYRKVGNQELKAKSHLNASTESCGDASTKSPTHAKIVHDLASREVDEQKTAARAVRIMTADDSSEDLDQLVKAGVIPHLVAILLPSWAELKSYRYDAAWALTNIAQEHKHIEAVVNAGAVAQLVRLLECGGDLAVQAALALGHIAQQGNRKQILFNGATSKLVSLMTPNTPPKLIVACLWSYGIIASEHDLMFGQFLALPYIRNLLAMTDEQVLVEACSVLFYMTNELQQQKYFTPVVFTPELTSRLTALLGHATPRVQAAALKALENVMANNVLREQCLRGFLDHVINLLKCENLSLVEDSLRAVVDILRGTPVYINEVLDKGVLEALVPALTEGNDQCKVLAVVAVTAVCTKGSASQLCKLVNDDALEPYCQLLDNPEYSYDVLRGLTHLLQNIEQNARDTLCQKLKEFEVPELLKPMREVQEYEDELVRERADLLLKTYFVDEVNEKGRL